MINEEDVFVKAYEKIFNELFNCKEARKSRTAARQLANAKFVYNKKMEHSKSVEELGFDKAYADKLAGMSEDDTKRLMEHEQNYSKHPITSYLAKEDNIEATAAYWANGAVYLCQKGYVQDCETWLNNLKLGDILKGLMELKQAEEVESTKDSQTGPSTEVENPKDSQTEPSTEVESPNDSQTGHLPR